MKSRRSAPSIRDESEPSTASVSMVRTLLETCRDCALVTDLSGRIVYANPACREIFGEHLRVGSALIARAPTPPHVADERVTFDAAVRGLYDDPAERGRGEITLRGHGMRVYEWESQPVHDEGGEVVGRSFVLHDCSAERELAMLKGDFLSTVTHELRTPLTSVKGSLQLVLAKSKALSAIDRELLAISLKNADRLIRLINDLLDISRLELGRIELNLDTVAVPALVEEAVAGLRSYAAGRDVIIGCEVEDGLPSLVGDRDRLIQVLTNLVSNAVKFSTTGSRVAVRATRCGEDIAIAVRDWGVGIRASDHGRLFQRFQRLRARTSDEPGTGLGLAISKAIVDRHRGRITVDSREDEGSVFTVRLPSVPAPGRRGRDPGEVDGAVADVPTVLLVDQDADLAAVVDASLHGGCRVLRVERGVQALQAARAERPDVIVLDATLPDLGSLDVLRILRHTAATKSIPVVVIGPPSEHEGARALGAAGFLCKPVAVDDLRRLVADVLLGGRGEPCMAPAAVRLGTG